MDAMLAYTITVNGVDRIVSKHIFDSIVFFNDMGYRIFEGELHLLKSKWDDVIPFKVFPNRLMFACKGKKDNTVVKLNAADMSIDEILETTERINKIIEQHSFFKDEEK